jgi:hypothetical protein
MPLTFVPEIAGYRRSYRPRGRLRPRSGLISRFTSSVSPALCRPGSRAGAAARRGRPSRPAPGRRGPHPMWSARARERLRSARARCRVRSRSAAWSTSPRTRCTRPSSADRASWREARASPAGWSRSSASGQATRTPTPSRAACAIGAGSLPAARSSRRTRSSSIVLRCHINARCLSSAWRSAREKRHSRYLRMPGGRSRFWR